MKLADKIFSLQSFQRQFSAIVKFSCANTLPGLLHQIDIKEVDWNNIISCASILSNSKEFNHQEASLRIAQACLENISTSVNQKTGAAIILDCLTNRPAIKLAVKRKLLPDDFSSHIPMPLTLDISKRKIIHTIINGDKEIYFNSFQREAYNNFISADVVSVSAPTSAGKSFVLYQTLIQFIAETKNPLNLIYIVPTRALISQVEKDFRQTFKNHNITNVLVSSIPRVEPSELSNSKVFIFTQERLHWFRIENPTFKFNYIIVDEAQKISEGNRGILLQQKIEELIKTTPDLKIFYSSPLTSNPEVLYEDLDVKLNKQSVKTEFVAVNQNLLYVTQVPKDRAKWNVDLFTKNDRISLGTIELENRPTTDFKKIAFIANALSHPDGGSIIYMNKAAFAERIANILYDVVPVAEENSEIKELIKFCKKTVHKEFLLNKVLEKRIAFHYGNMPLLIREDIERLFEKGIIKYLICTSTLLEGVNLPAKTIFLKSPTRGSGNPLKGADFWNLAGRAGRLGKEFQGNIVCIEPESWEEKPNTENRKQPIIKSIDKISANYSELIDYLQQGTPRIIAQKRNDLEYAVTYFYSAYIEKDLEKILAHKNIAFYEALTKEFETLSPKIEIPDEIIKRNPGISPIAQQNILNLFKEKLGEIENYIPDLPEFENAVNSSYIRIVTMISRHFSGDFEGLSAYYAVLVVNWMRGYPLSVLIKSNFDYWVRKGKPRKLDVIIRETMQDVEEYARFKFAKYSACYIDILKYFFEMQNKKELIAKIPDLHIWLEFGVSQATQISLISLGLNRQTAITLSEFISNDSYSKAECLEWINRNDLSSLQLSEIILEEIRSTLGIEIKKLEA